LEFIKIYEDKGVSGAKDKRPGLDELRKAVKNHEFNAVVVKDFTRFGRSARDLLNNIQYLKDHGVEFVSIKDNIDTSTPVGALTTTILAGIAEFERETILARTSEGRLSKWRSHRTWVGQLPYGYEWDEKGERIVIVDEQAKIYKRIVDEYLDLNYSLNEICVRLNREHISTQKGKAWSTAYLSQLLRYTFHYGTTTVNLKKMDSKGKIIGDKPLSEHIPWEVPDIIKKSKWDEVQKKLKEANKRGGRPSKFKDVFLLHGLLRCGICGSAVVPLHQERRVPSGTL